ncbi:MAG: hypothetical protein IJ716_10860 [Lachnospiraceae bacterium]|nr:hypothetical protein [Lachnospiraceae bacterium]
MDYELSIIVPKDELEQTGLSVIVHEWGGSSFSCDPPQYMTKGGMIFEQEDIGHYVRSENIVADHNFVALYLKNGADMLHQLEWSINHQRTEPDRNHLLDFLTGLLELSQFYIYLVREDETVKRKYKVSDWDEMTHIISVCLNWDAPKDVLIYKV